MNNIKKIRLQCEDEFKKMCRVVDSSTGNSNGRHKDWRPKAFGEEPDDMEFSLDGFFQETREFIKQSQDKLTEAILEEIDHHIFKNDMKKILKESMKK